MSSRTCARATISSVSGPARPRRGSLSHRGRSRLDSYSTESGSNPYYSVPLRFDQIEHFFWKNQDVRVFSVLPPVAGEPLHARTVPTSVQSGKHWSYYYPACKASHVVLPNNGRPNRYIRRLRPPHNDRHNRQRRNLPHNKQRRTNPRSRPTIPQRHMDNLLDSRRSSEYQHTIQPHLVEHLQSMAMA